MQRPAPRGIVRALLALTVGLALLAGVASAIGHDPVDLGPGTVASPADNQTVVSVQGLHFRGTHDREKPARLVGAGPYGTVTWRTGGGPDGRWFYDVDPLPGGTLFVTATVPGETVVFEYAPSNDTRLWEHRFDVTDTHDADLINGDQILLAHMLAHDDAADVSRDRIFIYDRSRGAVVWEWTFHEHYPNGTAGGFGEDWTHVNDVDKVAEGTYLVSPRNFDQVIVVDRETKAITMRLGADEGGPLAKQHNPDLIRDARGRPTVVVADSGNDRVVEYTYTGADADVALSTPVSENEGEWERTWAVSGFRWPRDADRLPNGNTLVTDTLNHRVVEVTPEGRVVWEFFAPWGPYDAERLGTGPESSGPAMTTLDAEGTYTVRGGDPSGPPGQRDPGRYLVSVTHDWPADETIRWTVRRYSHVAPFVRPVWLSPWAFAYLSVALLVATPWVAVELLLRRQYFTGAVAAAVARLRDRFGTTD